MSRQRELSAYDVAAHYDEAYYSDLAQRYLRRSRFARTRIANVLSLLPPVAGRRVLDVGCGMGTFSLELARRGARAVGLDPAPAAIAAAQRIARSQGAVGAAFVRGDAARLPVRSDSVDIAVAADVTEHLDDRTLARVLEESARALRPGGTLVIYTPAPSHVFERLRARNLLLAPDPSHIGLRPVAALVGAAERARLTVTRVEYLPSHVPGLRRLERVLGRWVPLLRRRIGIVARKAEQR